MKNILRITVAFFLLLSACSSSQKSESLPNHIIGKNYELTRMEEPWEGEVSTEFISYIGYSEKDVVEKSSLIAKVEITEDPVEYTVNFEGERGTKEEQMSQVYKAKILKIYYSEYFGYKEGDIINIARSDYESVEPSNKKFTDSLYIKTYREETYILFLASLKNMQKQDEALAEKAGITPMYYYKAIDEVADYAIVSNFQGIIHCVNNTYEFSKSLESLGKNASVRPSTISAYSNITHFFVTDDNFDEDIQAMVNQYKK